MREYHDGNESSKMETSVCDHQDTAGIARVVRGISRKFKTRSIIPMETTFLFTCSGGINHNKGGNYTV